MYQLEKPIYFYLLSTILVFIVIFLMVFLWKKHTQKKFAHDIALRKINLLLKAQAKVDCLSPLFCKGIKNLFKDGHINLIKKT